MNTQTSQPGVTGSESSRKTGISSDTLHNGTQEICSHHFVHRKDANAATNHKTQDANSKIVCKTGISKNKKQHTIACEYIHTMVNGQQMTV